MGQAQFVALFDRNHGPILREKLANGPWIGASLPLAPELATGSS